MILSAIYNVFDGEELLAGSIKQIFPAIDVLIVVYQDVSNHGNKYTPDLSGIEQFNPILVKYSPDPNLNPTQNEKAKRQLGVSIALRNNCTHFLHLDCDEYYILEQFITAKNFIESNNLNGSAIQMYTYFQKPTFRLKMYDNYYVPFIHKLNRLTKMGHRDYPFYCDPTRSINTTEVTFLSSVVMHHFSWVRKNIRLKIENSSARKNIEKSNLINDYFKVLKQGDYLRDYDQEIIEVSDLFDLGTF